MAFLQRYKAAVRQSLAAQLLFYFALGTVLSALFIYLALYYIFVFNIEVAVRDSLMGQAEDIATAISIDAEGRWSVNMHEPMKTGYRDYFQNLKYRVMDSQGNMLATSEKNAMSLIPPDKLDGDQAFSFYTRRVDGLDLHVVNWQTHFRGKVINIQAARSSQFSDIAAEAVFPAMVQTALTMAAIVVFLMLVVVPFAIQRTLKPLHHLTRTAVNISPQNLHIRLPTAGVPTELQELVSSFNHILDRLQKGYEAQRRFVANAAHELKTPLALMRTHIDLYLPCENGERLCRDINNLSRRISQLIQLAEIEDGYAVSRGFSILETTVKAIVDNLQPIFRRENKCIQVKFHEGNGGVWVSIDATQVEVVLTNIIDNARRFAPAGSTVEISINQNIVSVDDEGQGISDADKPFVFERFWRKDTSSEQGSGLGLAIAREIMIRNGGEIRVTDANTGGASFRIIFPQSIRSLREYF